ncbi:MAG: beta/gamma crystallin-related protein [Gallionellaceae bacterium]|nr:beta/gamma crystallin-related protein [Gallionellaceae bacterium]
MNAILRNALTVAGLAIATQAAAEVTFYEHDNYRGRSFNTEDQVDNFKRLGFNDRASSVVVDRDWWQICEDAKFAGRCVILRPGRYASLSEMGLNDRISSARLVSSYERGDHHQTMSAPVAPWDYHRRYKERTYEAHITSVRAVVGPPEQRCWVEHEQVVAERHHSNAPGAIVGALIGGILGHQVGSGTGKDLATAGGAVAGAVVGANVSRDHNERQVTTNDVQHCANTGRYARPEYWDVTYDFRGREHRMQTTDRPGDTVTVNERGEPRL